MKQLHPTSRVPGLRTGQCVRSSQRKEGLGWGGRKVRFFNGEGKKRGNRNSWLNRSQEYGLRSLYLGERSFVGT